MMNGGWFISASTSVPGFGAQSARAQPFSAFGHRGETLDEWEKI